MPSPSSSPPPSAAVLPVFDVCHVGVALRTLLFVHGALALGAGWRAQGWADWLATASLGVVFVLPATLMWLGLACMAQHVLARQPRPVYWAAALGGGAALGWAAWRAWAALDAQAGVEPVPASWATAWAALSGAALAAGVVHWLEQRRQLQAPVAQAARVAELQARIRPHFLFNTLNSAVALVRLDPARAEAVLEDLAELFRAALAEPGGTVTLADELALAQRYLAIEQVRFGDRLKLSWQADPAADGARLPALVLQPLVENAVRHGIEPAETPGEVSVATRLERGRVVVEVSNTTAQNAPPLAGHGMGLHSVRERLYLLHDVALRFEAGAQPDGRWVVRFELPATGLPGGVQRG